MNSFDESDVSRVVQHGTSREMADPELLHLL
jgi:hypothetical protein